MLLNFFTQLFGHSNERMLKKYRKHLKNIEAHSSIFASYDSQQIERKSHELRVTLKDKNNSSQATAREELFALVREVSSRVLKMRHYDVQILGGLALCDNKIAEMGTGEGKTLMATLPACAMAFEGKKVYVVTVNDYLAKRDAQWMQPLYEAMGLSVGISYTGQGRVEKQQAYQCDIIYVTNNELGFDYLRDKMSLDARELVLPPLDFALVDEVDSILIDEARVPLIISGPKETELSLYSKIDILVPQLKQATGRTTDHLGTDVIDEQSGDFILDEKEKVVSLTDLGFEKLEQLLAQEGLLLEGDSLYAPEKAALLHHCLSSLRAHHLYDKDKDYIVHQGEVVIIDDHTGRATPGRRWGDGLHQAMEAKEGVKVLPETQTLASTTFQNFFRLFDKMAGMTGTADTEASELLEIYKLDVVVIPPNIPSKRIDHHDVVFVDDSSKYQAIIEEVKQLHEQGRPILLGTSAISQSEYLSSLLKKQRVEHTVLNAKQHEKEAAIVAQAGRKGSVTIATNMAGRGTDIVLGGTYQSFLEENSLEDNEHSKSLHRQAQEEVRALGGLAIIACQRHESRRIDNQLRGRAGRQGDNGSSKFYISLDDHLMRVFMPQAIRQMLTRLQDNPKEPLPGDKMLSRKIEQVQRTIEAHHFDVRKQVLEFDDVSNQQRQIIYDCRDQILLEEDSLYLLHSYIEQSISQIIDPFIQSFDQEQWKCKELCQYFEEHFDITLDSQEILTQDYEKIRPYFIEFLKSSYAQKTQSLCQEQLERFQKTVILQSFDKLWREHISTLDSLRQNIRLQRFAQKDPRQQYKLEAYALFEKLMSAIAFSITQTFLRVRFYSQEQIDTIEKEQKKHIEQVDSQHQHDSSAAQISVGTPKVGRNEKCPCGSGRKYKFCCGSLKESVVDA